MLFKETIKFAANKNRGKKLRAVCGHSKFSFEIIKERTIELIRSNNFSKKGKKNHFEKNADKI